MSSSSFSSSSSTHFVLDSSLSSGTIFSISSCGIKRRRRRFHSGLFRRASWSRGRFGSNKEDESVVSCSNVENVLSTWAVLHNPGIPNTERR
jgi:hypothetical protein